MRFVATSVVMLLALCSGCSTAPVSLQQSFWRDVESEAKAQSSNDTSDISSDASSTAWIQGLKHSYGTTGGISVSSDTSASPLPTDLQNNRLISKLWQANVTAVSADDSLVESDIAGDKEAGKRIPKSKSAKVTISKSDAEDMVKLLQTQLMGDDTTPVAADAGSAGFGVRFQLYTMAYVNGKFVDRFGNALEKPDFSGGISNDAITGMTLVLHEALYDQWYSIPVWYTLKDGKPVCLTPTAKEPTCAALKVVPRYYSSDTELPAKKEETDKTDQEIGVDSSITAVEATAVNSFSIMAGEQTQLLAGLIFREFKEVGAGIIVVPGFAIGDNQTIAKLIDVTTTQNGRRGTHALAYKFFRKHDFGKYGTKMNTWMERIQLVYKLLYQLEKKATSQPATSSSTNEGKPQ